MVLPAPRHLPARLPTLRPPHRCPPPSAPRRLSVKPTNPPADDPQCIYCYRPPSANALALAKFVDYASQLEDVWFVTHSDLVRAWLLSLSCLVWCRLLGWGL